MGENKHWPPYSNSLGDQVLALHAVEASQTHEPVAANATQEYLKPSRVELLFGRGSLDS